LLFVSPLSEGPGRRQTRQRRRGGVGERGRDVRGAGWHRRRQRQPPAAHGGAGAAARDQLQ